MEIKLLRRRGWTLVDVVVVMSVCGLLLSLLLPHLQASRSLAREAQCTNNMKQIGLALHNYYQVYLTFPPGYTAGPGVKAVATGDKKAGSRWAWSVVLLPFIDQARLYGALNVNRNGAVAAAGSENDKSLDVFLCPQDSGPQRGPGPIGKTKVGYSDAKGNYYQRSNYVAVNGADAKVFTGFANNSKAEVRGCFGHSTSTRFRDITDGTSNTLLVGERDMTKDYGAIWIRATRGEPYQAQAVLGVTGVALNSADLRKKRPSRGPAGTGSAACTREALTSCSGMVRSSSSLTTSTRRC